MADLAEARRGGVISDEMTDEAIASLKKPVDAPAIREILDDFLAK